MIPFFKRQNILLLCIVFLMVFIPLIGNCQTYYYEHTNAIKNQDSDGLTFIITLVCTFLFGCIAYVWISKSYWDNGKIPPWHKRNNDNIGEMLVHVAINIMIRGKSYHLENIILLRDSLKQLGFVSSDFMTDIQAAKVQYIKTSCASEWLNKALVMDAKKSFSNCLIEIMKSNGVIDQLEIKEFQLFCQNVGLTYEDFRPIIDEINLNFSKSSRSENQSSQVESKELMLDKALKYFNFTVLPSLAELKKSYRKLVKTCHPDNFTKLSEKEKLEKESLFNELQRNYEFLLIRVS